MLPKANEPAETLEAILHEMLITFLCLQLLALSFSVMHLIASGFLLRQQWKFCFRFPTAPLLPHDHYNFLHFNVSVMLNVSSQRRIAYEWACCARFLMTRTSISAAQSGTKHTDH